MAENNKIPVIERDSRVTQEKPIVEPVVAPMENPIVEPTQPVIEPPTQVTLNSGQTTELTPNEAKLRTQNLANQGIKPDTAPKVVDKAPEINEKERFELDNSKKQVVIQEEQKKLERFRELMQTNASKSQLADFVNENPTLRKEFQIGFKNFFKDKQNFDFQQKYATATPQKLYEAYVNSDIVIGDKNYNLLPPATKQAFEQFKAKKEIIATKEEVEKSLENDKTKIYGEAAEEKPTFVGMNIREEYEKLTSNPEYTAKRTEVEGLSTRLTQIKDNIESIEEEVLAEYESSGRTQSFIYAEIQKRQRVASKEYRQVSAEYTNALASFSDMKTDIQQEKELLLYENEMEFKQYQTQLSQYNADRNRMDNFAILEFEQKNNQIVRESEQEYKKELIEFQNKLNLESTSGGDYLDDGNGNIVYVKDGKQIGVLEGLGAKVNQGFDGEFEFKDFYDEKKGVITTFTRNPKTGEMLSVETFNVNGEKSGDYIDNLGTGKVTSYGGDYDKGQGLDVDVQMGDPVYAPFNGTIVEATSSAGYGINIVVKDDATGNKVRFSHLDPSLLYNGGTKFEKGAIIAKAGNTGNVLKMDGTKPTKSELAQGFGSHLDIVSYKPDGSPRNAYETEEFLRNLGKEPQAPSAVGDFSFSEVTSFNNPTFKPQDLDEEQEARFNEFKSEKSQIMRDKNANIQEVLRYSEGGGALTATQEDSLSKFQSVISQIGDIQEQISDLETGPIQGRLAEMNPYNTDAQVLKAQLTGLIPNLARGVYGEVGVLTDADIRNYAKTIPNLTSTEDVNKAILAMNLKVVGGGYKRQLQNLASANRDVASYEGLYNDLMDRVSLLESEVGIPQTRAIQINGKEIDINKYTEREEINLDSAVDSIFN